jgi:cytochrome oxidase assembly protein ShyY1
MSSSHPSTPSIPRDAEPTLGQVLRRPRWIAGFFLALLVAAVLAGLAQWQFDRAVESGSVVLSDKEDLVPLTEIQDPQMATTSEAAGHRVSVTGTWISGQDQIIANRINAGVVGYWVVSPLTEERTGATLSIARGWAATIDEAEAAMLPGGAADPVDLEGRYLPAEAPLAQDADQPLLTTMAPAALINLWELPQGARTYNGYLILEDEQFGVDTIGIAEQDGGFELNWLNIFYAVEWVLFAAGAIYLWYRLAKDDWQREHELAELRAEEPPVD